MSVARQCLTVEAVARLKAFKREVEKALPGQVTEMRLFGSRARGDATGRQRLRCRSLPSGRLGSVSGRTILSDAAYPHVIDGYFIRAISVPSNYLGHVNGYRPELADEIARHGFPIG
jgi:hypothetical protein